LFLEVEKAEDKVVLCLESAKLYVKLKLVVFIAAEEVMLTDFVF